MSHTTTPLRASPFTDDYWKQEIAFLGLPRRKQTCGKVEVDWPKASLRCDDYFNMNFRANGPRIPRLSVEGNLQMSLSAMEVQSAAVTLHRARGNVVTGGLGLGYFALRAAAKPEVSHVLVYEQEPDVVQWFNRAYKGRSELAKIEVITDDVRRAFVNCTADIVYMDIYDSILPNKTLSDFKHFTKKNRIGRYHFWGWERVIQSALCDQRMQGYLRRLFRVGSPAFYMGSDLRSLLTFWQEHKLDRKHTGLDLALRPLDVDFTRKAVDMMTVFYPL